MTNSDVRYKIYGRTRLGGLTVLPWDYSLGDAVRKLHLLNKHAAGTMFHHFLIRDVSIDMEAEFIGTVLPGETFEKDSALIGWLVATGIVKETSPGRFLFDGVKYRGFGKLAREFSIVQDGKTVVSRICYEGMKW